MCMVVFVVAYNRFNLYYLAWLIYRPSFENRCPRDVGRWSLVGVRGELDIVSFQFSPFSISSHTTPTLLQFRMVPKSALTTRNSRHNLTLCDAQTDPVAAAQPHGSLLPCVVFFFSFGFAALSHTAGAMIGEVSMAS